MKLKAGIVLLVAALGLGVEAKHYSFVGGYPANGVSEARAASMECNSGVKADVKVTKVKLGIMMA